MSRLNQRTIVIAVMVIYAILSPLVGLLVVGDYGPMVGIGGIIGGVAFGALALAYARGWEPARYTVLLITLLLCALTMPLEGEFVPASALIAPLLALLFAGPGWVIGTAIVQLVAFMVRGYADGGLAGMGPYGTVAGLLIYGMAIVVLIFSRLVVDVALRRAEEHAAQAEQALARSEAQAAELSSQAADLSRRNEEQSQLLELISALETPAVTLADGVLLAPVVGALDSRRAQDLTARLLREVSERRAHHIVLDIAGVAHVDTEVAASLLRLTQALRLLGCAVTLTGISAPVAASLTQLGVSLGDVRVARSPQEVLAVSAA